MNYNVQNNYEQSFAPSLEVGGSVATLERPTPSVPTRRDVGSGYVSVFEEPSGFDQYWRLAETLARSSFVPESFRGKTGDCLIALDLALSLGLKPTSLFPHLYVISGRPALSAQFLIALVNRSGRFSRIRWTEEDGPKITVKKATGTRDNRKYIDVQIPNYSAKASFTEAKTGQTLMSTKIDVAFAFANGWTSKDQSNWLTMPREMLRYRTASFLIKAYCPELIFGLEFAEDVEDAQTPTVEFESRPTTRTVVLTADDVSSSLSSDESSEKTNDDATAEAELLAKIAAAETPESLSSVGEEIATEPLAADAKARLRRAYKERRDAMKSPAKEAKTNAKKAVAEKSEKAKKSDKPEKMESEKRDELEEAFDACAAKIRDAKTFEELRALFCEGSPIAPEFKKLTPEKKRAIKDAFDRRSAELDDGEEDADDETNPDERAIVDAIRVAKTQEDFSAVLEKIEEAGNSGRIDRDAADRLEAALEARCVDSERSETPPNVAPTPGQTRYYTSMKTSLEHVPGSDKIDDFSKTIESWRSRGLLTDAQAGELSKLAQEKRKTFLV